jgi:hypothetical protein
MRMTLSVGATALAVVCHLGWVTGCHLYQPRVKVTGQYFLCRTDTDKYYLVRGSGGDATTLGVVDGWVLSLGWDGESIIVLRQPAVGSGGPDWILVDVKHHTLGSPMRGADWQQARTGDVRLRRLTVYSASQAWELLDGP